MRCIFCSLECPPSLEHVIPRSIGGRITNERVCAECNSILGRRVDSALADFLPVRTRRAELGLAGNSGKPPSMFEIFLGDQKLIGPEANRIRTTLDEKTGKLDHRQLYHATDMVMPDGKKARNITIDARDKDQIPKIIQRERKRNGLPPLSPDELAEKAKGFTVTTVEQPVVQVNLEVSFAFLRHAMMKIAYEFAFQWLGESYLDDPLAAELRDAIMKDDLASTDGFEGYVGWAEPCAAFNFWTPHKAHHLAFASVVAGRVIVAVRLFDIYAVAITVSRDASRYVKAGADGANLPFVAIDTATGRTIATTFGEERHRLAREMTRHRRTPPFPDPLPSDDNAEPHVEPT